MSQVKISPDNPWVKLPEDWHSIRNRLLTEKASQQSESGSPKSSSNKPAPQELDETIGLSGSSKKDPLHDRVHLFGEKLSEFTLSYAANPETSTSKYREVIEFWGISKSFCKIQFQKVGEFAVKKYSQGRKNDSCPVRVFKSLVNFRQPRWLCVGRNNLWYYKDSTDEPVAMRDNVMIDQQCSVVILDVNTSKVKMELKMARRNIKIGVKDTMRGLIVLHSLTKAFQNSNYTKLHRFASFAPPRPLQQVHLYADAIDYYKDIFQLLTLAKDEIMIAGWMISPEVPFLRNDESKISDDSSLMTLLKKAADRGVKVYVLVYQEVQATMYNDSEHCKKVLEFLNKTNIKVLRHPTSIGQALFWSHHEKICIVDRKVVMMGGLDLAWGRWDTQSHDLFDYSQKRNAFPGVDYYNAFKKDFEKGKWKDTPLTPDTPRMPWHDVAIRLTGPVVFDYLTHFVTYFNNSRELNNEPQVLFSQMSLTNPKYAISNSIKELLKAKIGSVTALDMLIEKKLKRQAPNAKGPITLESDNKFSNSLRSETQKENPIPTDEVQSESTAPTTAEVVNDIKKWIYMNSDEERQLNKEIDLVKREETKYGEKYGDNVFKKLDIAYVKDVFLAPEDDPVTNYRQPIYNLGLIEPEEKKPEPQSQQGGALENLSGFLGFGSSAQQKSDLVAPIKPEHVHPHLATLKEGIFSSSISPGEVWLNKDFQIRFKYVPTSTKEEIIRFMNPKQRNGFGEDEAGDEVEDESDLEIIPDEGAIKTSFKSFGRSKTSGGQGQIKISNNSFIQALRSASPWSIGLDKKECSIMNCYIETIENAKRYIYIENQFFISSVNESKSNEDVRNRLAKALYKRIKLAIDRREQFKVVVCMPLLPAFEADLQKKEGDVMLMQIALENMTIGFGKNSLFEKIKQHTDHPENYFMVCGLRRWQYPPHPTELDTSPAHHHHHPAGHGGSGHADEMDKLINKTFTRRAPDTSKDPQTELIYIHSKVAFALNVSY